DFADTKIRAHWVDDDEHYVANPLERLPQQLQISDEAEAPLLTVDPRAVDEKDALRVSTGRDQAWQDGVTRVVFGVEPDHIPLWRVAFVARQLDRGRDGTCDEGGDLSFAVIG